MYVEMLRKDPNFRSVCAGDEEKIIQIREYLDGSIPPTFEVYLRKIGSGGVWYLDIFGTSEQMGLIERDKHYHDTSKNANNAPSIPRELVILSDVGEDISWFLDMSSRRKDGECRVVGYILGLPSDKQPRWLKEQEYYESFKEFAYKKIAGNNTKLLDYAPDPEQRFIRAEIVPYLLCLVSEAKTQRHTDWLEEQILPYLRKHKFIDC